MSNEQCRLLAAHFYAARERYANALESEVRLEQNTDSVFATCMKNEWDPDEFWREVCQFVY